MIGVSVYSGPLKPGNLQTLKRGCGMALNTGKRDGSLNVPQQFMGPGYSCPGRLHIGILYIGVLLYMDTPI